MKNSFRFFFPFAAMYVTLGILATMISESMKWVIFANLGVLIVVGILIFVEKIKRHVKSILRFLWVVFFINWWMVIVAGVMFLVWDTKSIWIMTLAVMAGIFAAIIYLMVIKQGLDDLEHVLRFKRASKQWVMVMAWLEICLGVGLAFSRVEMDKWLVISFAPITSAYTIIGGILVYLKPRMKTEQMEEILSFLTGI